MSLRASLLAILGLVGCVAESRPQGAQLSTELDSDEIVGFAVPASPDPEPIPTKACDPGSSRDCKIYTAGSAGTWNCFASTQGCRSDGAGWHACGDAAAVAADPIRAPIATPAPTTAKADDAGPPELVK